MSAPRYPALLQLDTRVRLAERAAALGRPATLDDLVDRLAEDGFDLLWLLGVWQTGEAARRVSASNPEWRAEYRRVLPDFRESDVCGSCFAIQDYRVHADFGGDAALARLRERLQARGLRLILDFVPNHLAPDHRWVEEHPEFFVAGSEAQLAAEPHNYRRLETASGSRILAYGRDPCFAGWSDTLQLNYGQPALQEAMLGELRRIAGQCDAVRCDMAMLLLPEVFERTWGIAAAPFWPRATAAIHAERPGFLFLAEVYWDLEWTLQQQGFDYTYDKRLYDRLVAGQAGPVREHLRAGLDFQDRLARFLENHDEPRAAATFAADRHRAAAAIAFLSPGLRFFHQGQREGRRVRLPTHLGRGPAEMPDAALAAFYDALLACLKEPALRDGHWQLLDARPAWAGNPSHDALIVFAWSGPGERRYLVAVNYADHPSQGYVGLPWHDLAGRTWQLHDRLGPARYARDGTDLATRGLYLDLPAWGCHAFEVRAA
ncbi:alpha-amylase family glycosyl hydrolase [Azotobacter beijerinckii]|uniref:alpha-amylase family glycosyl hydrolase n=1 Tax=Azotobacter beijerinckii TaxID=170623 RepID=UPI0029548B91|nr:alpha-amylase family glycosyl hydrolase [Azotobacter beijerinckii]MDV7213636.1 alpha-amylase family glycosyl hydrolase [Azotobacter beijerinckii]